MRKTVQIPINGYLLENTDDKANKGAYVSSAFDIIIDILKVNTNRPALQCKYYDTSSGIINGLYYWEAKDIVIGVINGVAYQFDKINDEEYEITDISGGITLNVTNKVYFASNSTYVNMANGGRMLNWAGSTGVPSAYVTDADAPTTVDVLAYIDNYILALDKTNNKWYYSDATAGINSPITWSGDYYSFEGKPDNVTSIIVSNSMIYGFCTSSVELWYNDATPFSRISGGVLNTGCTYTDTIQELDGIIYYLGSDKHVYAIANTNFKSLSLLIDNELSSLDFTDSYADIININGLKFYILTIPNEDTTYVYAINDNGWLKWSNYSNGVRTEFGGRYFISEPDILGVSNSSIALYKLNPDGEVDDNIEIETPTVQYYDEDDMEAGIEPWDGIDLSMVNGKNHTYQGNAIFRADQSETTFDVSYNDFGSDNLVTERTSTDASSNFNKRYEVECVSGGTGTDVGEIKFNINGGAINKLFEVWYEKTSPPAENYFPYYYYGTPSAYNFKLELYNPYTGPIGSTCTLTRAGGIVSSAGGFITANIKSHEFDVAGVDTILITVTAESQKNAFRINRLSSYPIVFNKVTSWLDHGTPNYKVSRLLKIKLDRDYVNYINPGADFELRFRNNGSDWSNWISMEIQQDSDGFYSYLRNLGRYSSRQYEIRCLYPIKFSIDKIYETIDITNRQL